MCSCYFPSRDRIDRIKFVCGIWFSEKLEVGKSEVRCGRFARSLSWSVLYWNHKALHLHYLTLFLQKLFLHYISFVINIFMVSVCISNGKSEKISYARIAVNIRIKLSGIAVVFRAQKLMWIIKMCSYSYLVYQYKICIVFFWNLNILYLCFLFSAVFL